MTEEKTCYNCGNKNCNVYYSIVKKDYKRHFETYEYNDFDCVNHDKWEELKIEEIHTDNTKTLQNALNRIEELEEQIEKMKGCHNCRHFAEPYKLCCYSLGDEDYDCRGRKWEIKGNDTNYK